MSFTTNVPPPAFGNTGFVAPAESAILAGVQADWNAAFSGYLNPALETAQGQLATSETAVIGQANAQFLALANGVDPAYASGRMQDAIGRIYYLTRIPAAATVAQVTCSGAVGTIIPAGATIKATDGNLYSATNSASIPAGGSVVVSFACQATGPIVCPAQTFDIYRLIPGWDTAVSSAAGAVGNNVETRAAFEARRSASVASNSKFSNGAILGAILAVPGVLDAYVTDNSTGETATIGGISIGANELYVAVVGGSASTIGQAILSKKPPGIPYYPGNTTVTVYDNNPVFITPPAYSVTFEIPDDLTIKFAVTIANGSDVPSNATQLVQTAIVSAFSGGDGGPRATIGGTIYASRFYAPIAALGSWVRIVSILVGTSSATLNSVSVNINQEPVTSAVNISVSAV